LPSCHTVGEGEVPVTLNFSVIYRSEEGDRYFTSAMHNANSYYIGICSGVFNVFHIQFETQQMPKFIMFQSLFEIYKYK
jgi:hypothetical protein